MSTTPDLSRFDNVLFQALPQTEKRAAPDDLALFETTTAEAFQRAWGQYTDRARQAPIVVSKYDRPHLVVCNADEFRRWIAAVRAAQDIMAALMPTAPGLSHAQTSPQASPALSPFMQRPA